MTNQAIPELGMSDRYQPFGTLPSGATGQIYDSLLCNDEIGLAAGVGHNVSIEMRNNA